MSIIIIQLSDLHITTQDDEAVHRWPALCRAVESETTASAEISACVVLFCGDAAHAGKKDQFGVVANLLATLKQAIKGVPVYILTIPGNHDCDLTSKDDAARLALRNSVTHELPPNSTAHILLQVQANYFAFAAAVGEPNSSLTLECPYYRPFIINADGRRIRFDLFNTAWTSILNETDDLRFPVSVFNPRDEVESDIAIAVLHHPIHWLLEASVRRPLRNAISDSCDFVLTAHEHQSDVTRIGRQGHGEVDYIQGGVLQEGANPSLCSFNVIMLDLSRWRRQVKRFFWSEDHFELEDEPVETEIPRANRLDRALRLRSHFEEWLDELEDPISHPREPNLRLCHVFSYPELRKLTESRPDSTDAQVAPDSLPRIRRIRSEEVIAEISEHSRILITGGDRSGKTSLSKRLFADLRLAGKAPAILRGGDLSNSGSEPGLRQTCETAITKTYQFLTPASYEQLPIEQRVLILDDFHDSPRGITRAKIMSFFERRFGQIIFVASDDLNIEVMGASGDATVSFGTYQRYELCDFGHVRLQDLTERWLALGNTQLDAAALADKTRDTCARLESLLSLAGLPHTPWLLTVILSESEAVESSGVAAKNGDYAHLYHALATFALSRSRLRQFDIHGKFTYLGELAHFMYTERRSALTYLEFHDFHSKHCDRFDLTFSFDSVSADFLENKMMRLDEDEYAFRHKWVYCFYMAWWLSRNIHEDRAAGIVADMANQLYHDVSANVLLFLTHLSDDPKIINQMREAARSYYRAFGIATLQDDARALGGLAGFTAGFMLPATSPEENRRLIHDQQDERLVISTPQNHDGRSIKIVPDESDERREIGKQLEQVRGALQTLRIIGQVLRNGASSIEAAEKTALMEEVIGVAGRLLGYIYSQESELIVWRKQLRHRLMRTQLNAGQGATREHLRKVQAVARARADGYVFDMVWLASLGMIRRVADAIGMPLLDPTLERVRKRMPTVFVELTSIAVNLGRRKRRVCSDQIVALHKRLAKAQNELPRNVLRGLEAIPKPDTCSTV